ncbi:hypothetical protein HGP13_33600 [Mesorhizobium sp. NZP2077]|uniref:hypothetical protein n=1 Tax=Mesorhizobium TaxID=68287 RepID=UPI0013FD384D|nr:MULTISPECIES: hypothetical protein [Mesorhizobium]QKD19510.1 hypothetical protein HGP13_33600 [Mesorhizobium sp. NZP2077]
MPAARQFRRARARFWGSTPGCGGTLFASHSPAFLSKGGVDPAEITERSPE